MEDYSNPFDAPFEISNFDQPGIHPFIGLQESLDSPDPEKFTLTSEVLRKHQDSQPKFSFLHKFLHDQRHAAGYNSPEAEHQSHDRNCFPKPAIDAKTIKSDYIDSPQGIMSPEKELQASLNYSDLKCLEDIRKKKLLEPIKFNVIVVGDSGVGKTSFINTFLSMKFNRFVPEDLDNKMSRPTIKIEQNSAIKVAGDLTYKVNMIDTPGYGKAKNFSIWLKGIKNFIIHSATQYKHAKKSILKPEDTRVHLCLYFIEGPRCKERDLRAMFQLQKYVQIIPILAKADSYQSKEEIEGVKRNLINEIFNSEIKLFDFMSALGNDKHLITNAPLQPLPPFAVISAAQLIETQSKIKYGRSYQWGFCDISDKETSDFSILSKFLMGYFVDYAIGAAKIINKNNLREIKNKVNDTKKNAGIESMKSKLLKGMVWGLFGLILKGN
ncbi:unnamed protein product [Blepharisma stoltei]|uniref:Septin-type G domain-containing protein n=1 Tax=Blepharisma stoltei TaxID=1481888 RepID=A0AAU9JX45_9CILI|nr:unnamed protein product [Blepharisma stoltei]